MGRHRNFTPEEVQAVRQEYLDGALNRALCEKYMVSRTTMSKVLQGLTPVRQQNPNRKISGKPRIRVVANGVLLALTETQKFFYDTLLTSSCVDCGETNIVLLDFDHLDPREKVYSVAQLKACVDNIDMVRAEMAKCQVRCVSCHRLKTAAEAGWKSYHLEEERKKQCQKSNSPSTP